ncbi:MAG: hypothetical protein KDE53_20100, partial [Caldilineaceae bacterium]|nr:hypothetical protein [Caldilineaceae bacterium]
GQIRQSVHAIASIPTAKVCTNFVVVKRMVNSRKAREGAKNSRIFASFAPSRERIDSIFSLTCANLHGFGGIVRLM